MQKTGEEISLSIIQKKPVSELDEDSGIHWNILNRNYKSNMFM